MAKELKILNTILILVNSGAGEERAIAMTFSKCKPPTFYQTGEPKVVDD